MLMKKTLTTNELQKCAHLASKQAVERAVAKQIPYTVQEGKSIVRHIPDGTTEIIQTLPKAYVKLNNKRFKIASNA